MILGIRLAMLALRELKRDVAAHGARDLVVVVETDRCLPDAIELVTGCRLGNRSLKFKDLGKMAATFVDLEQGKAIRVAARESANQLAQQRFPTLDRETALAKTYSLAADQELLSRAWVRARITPEDVPGYHGPRTVCTACGEGIAFGREVRDASRTLCLACAGRGYYEPA
jgi:formylmethanofuran dehydrogenase subunit E